MAEKPRILLLGGGFAGMFSAKEIERRLGWKAEVELINQVNYFVFHPLLPEIAAGSITIRDAVSPLRQLLPGVRVRQGMIWDVDFDRKVVTVFQGTQRRYSEVSYDHLVIALGQTVDLSRFPGLSDHAMTMKSLSDAMRLRNHVIDKLEHADITGIPEIKRELLTFTVIGGGFSGVETVGEMQELIARSLNFYPNIDRSEIRILLIEFTDRLLPELPPSLGLYAQKHLEKRGIEPLLKTGVSEATGTHIVTSTGEVIGTRTVVATIGNAPSPIVTKLNLPNQNGRVQVDRMMRVEGRTDVWSLGDAALIPLVDGPSKRDDYAPPTAQFAVREAKTLADNIEAVLDNRAPLPFVYKSKGSMASLGAHRGVAEIYGIKLSGWIAWLLWRFYYLSFVPGFATKIRIAMNWMLDGIVGRSTVQVGAPQAAATRYIRYRAGDTVWEPGNRADGFYSVIEGAFELRFTLDGEDHVEKIGPGQHFGDLALLGGMLRTGSVTALEDSKVLMLGAEDFRRLCGALPVLGDFFSHSTPAAPDDEKQEG